MGDACCGDDTPPDAAGEGGGEPERLREVTELRAAVLSGVALVGSFIAEWSGDGDAVVVGLQMAALVVGAATFVPASLSRLARGKIGVGTLMTIAAAGAVALGEVAEAAMLAFLFSISEGLEEYSLTKTRRGLRALLSLVPEEATVVGDAGEAAVPAGQLQPGDIMVVRPGERIATDGTVRSGRSALDVSAITGESVPVEAGPNDEVFAGSINGTGALHVQVTAATEDNSLARIVSIVETEQGRKGSSQRLADRVAKPLVPGVMVAAAAIAVLGSLAGDPQLWIERALVVLVAASPCALAISVPVTVVAAVGAASRQGVLIKGGGALEALGAVRGVALDKTGTLTRNQPSVVEVATVDGVSRRHVLELAAALGARSAHPLARAILDSVDVVTPAADVQSVTGAGLVGCVGGRVIRLGRPGWLHPEAQLADRVEVMQHGGATAVLVEDDGRIIGAVAVRDELRPEARDVVDHLRRTGYEVAMLTGDNAATASALARAAGIGDVQAELRPEDKARIVAQLTRQRPTAMVGDGVNDAPALATAHLGIAMGAMGTDVAIETADVALMGHDLRHLPQVLDHARRARRIMFENLGLSMAIVTVLVPLALFGALGLATVVAIHEFAEVVVIANGVRAGRTPALPTAPAPAPLVAVPA
ncbi:MAG TPA: cation-translocating P-type ATPase [Acidimicrobiales bacterium]|nr:cation-translocating P-type ATPase [Acidimicrobiales bacterium]